MTAFAILKTDGGPHPPDKWAALLASQICSLIAVDDLSSSPEAIAAREAKAALILDLSNRLSTHFNGAMNAETARVNNGQVTQRHDPFSSNGFITAAKNVAESRINLTQFASHFSIPEVQQEVRNIITQCFIDAMNVQRSWAFDAKGQ